MIFLLIILALAVPYLVGAATILVLGERNHGGIVKWAVGALSLFACFFVCILVTLWFDYSLYQLSRLFGIVCAALTAGAVPVLIYAMVKNRFEYRKIDKEIVLWLIPAIIVGAVSILLINPVYVNDITVETVRTTLATGKIYEYSSLLGTKMEAGLPIFNKIEIVPLLYAVLCRDYGIDVITMTTYLAPLATFTANMFIMWEISEHVCEQQDRNLFMFFHLVILVVGTYLPKTAIPVTLGQPLLMQGYSGYAWAYGVVIPLTILMLMDKRFILAAIVASPIVGLMRYDRLFFAFKNFFTSYHMANAAGKLLGIYFVAVLWWAVKKKKNGVLPYEVLLSGSTLISATLVNAYKYVGRKKSFVVFSTLLLLACCNFIPYKNADLIFNDKEINLEAMTEGVSDVTIWAPAAVMEEARRGEQPIKTVYGRDLYEDMLDGVNYEPYSEDARDLLNAMQYVELYMGPDVEELVLDAVKDNEAFKTVDVVVFPKNRYSEVLNTEIAKKGYYNCNEVDEYVVMRRYE